MTLDYLYRLEKREKEKEKERKREKRERERENLIDVTLEGSKVKVKFYKE